MRANKRIGGGQLGNGELRVCVIALGILLRERERQRKSIEIYWGLVGLYFAKALRGELFILQRVHPEPTLFTDKSDMEETKRT